MMYSYEISPYRNISLQLLNWGWISVANISKIKVLVNKSDSAVFYGQKKIKHNVDYDVVFMLFLLIVILMLHCFFFYVIFH